MSEPAFFVSMTLRHDLSNAAQRGLEDKLFIVVGPGKFAYRNGELLFVDLETADTAFPLIKSIVDCAWTSSGQDITDRFLTVSDTHGMRCPACQRDTHLDVEIVIYGRLVHGGISYGDARTAESEWTDSSPCSCSCGWVGTVAEAKTRFPDLPAPR